tara:strand:+ start:124 stop:480 length:357 start_codon:yes stop_codon:yes gene_type:complete
MTPKQLKVLEAIEYYWEQQHCGPSLEAIAEIVGVSSRSTVHAIVKRLTEDGWITMQPKRWRTMMSTRNSPLGQKKISSDNTTGTFIEQKKGGLSSLVQEPQKDELDILLEKHLTNMRR